MFCDDIFIFLQSSLQMGITPIAISVSAFIILIGESNNVQIFFTCNNFLPPSSHSDNISHLLCKEKKEEEDISHAEKID